MKKQSYFQGTTDPKKKRKSDEFPINRLDMDIRHPNIYTHFKNYDYTEEDSSETSPGSGLYHGPMDRFKSVKDFLDKRRKEINTRREKAQKRSKLLQSLVTKVG